MVLKFQYAFSNRITHIDRSELIINRCFQSIYSIDVSLNYTSVAHRAQL